MEIFILQYCRIIYIENPFYGPTEILWGLVLFMKHDGMKEKYVKMGGYE